MSKFFIVVMLSVLGTSALSASCKHESGEYFQLIENPANAKEWLQKNPTKYAEFDKKYGPAAAQSVMANRYTNYLAQVGCGRHVTDGEVVPVTSLVRMTKVTMPEAELINLCKEYFPNKWKVDGKSELWIKVPSGVLRYRGRECSLLSFD